MSVHLKIVNTWRLSRMSTGAAIIGLALCLGAFGVSRLEQDGKNQPDAPAKSEAAPIDNEELKELFKGDQADRNQPNIAEFHELEARDAARQLRVRELLDAGEIQTGADYYRAAMVCQHSPSLEGIQLAHELSMIGAALGNKGARWLAAASYDRLLRRLELPQRFGTQFEAKSGEPMSLAPVSPGLTDGMRKALGVPALDKSKAKAEQLRKQLPENIPGH